MWENSSQVLRQLDQVGLGKATKLEKSGIVTFEQLANANPRLVEAICGRNPPFGNVIVEEAQK